LIVETSKLASQTTAKRAFAGVQPNCSHQILFTIRAGLVPANGDVEHFRGLRFRVNREQSLSNGLEDGADGHEEAILKTGDRRERGGRAALIVIGYSRWKLPKAVQLASSPALPVNRVFGDGRPGIPPNRALLAGRHLACRPRYAISAAKGRKPPARKHPAGTSEPGGC
jgi:hypothetical protein